MLALVGVNIRKGGDFNKCIEGRPGRKKRGRCEQVAVSRGLDCEQFLVFLISPSRTCERVSGELQSAKPRVARHEHASLRETSRDSFFPSGWRRRSSWLARSHAVD